MAPIVVAHRGLDEYAPENTLSAIAAALELRVAVEIDVQRTADGELVIIHDDTVDRTTVGTGAVAEMTLYELRQLDAGSWFSLHFAGERVPTLSEVTLLISERGRTEVTLVLEPKTSYPGIETDICDLLGQFGLLGQTVGIGADIQHSPEARKRYRQADPNFNAAVGARTPEMFGDVIDDPYSSWVLAAFPPAHDLYPLAHDAGKRVLVSGPEVRNNVRRCGHRDAVWRRPRADRPPARCSGALADRWQPTTVTAAHGPRQERAAATPRRGLTTSGRETGAP